MLNVNYINPGDNQIIFIKTKHEEKQRKKNYLVHIVGTHCEQIKTKKTLLNI